MSKRRACVNKHIKFASSPRCQVPLAAGRDFALALLAAFGSSRHMQTPPNPGCIASHGARLYGLLR